MITEEGVHHTFSSFGAGALAGARTLLTRHVLVDPLRLFKERLVLAPKVGGDSRILRPYVHEDCLVITPFHAALNRLKERARGEGRHGSCGVGIGETMRYALDQTERGQKDTILTMRMLEAGGDAARYALEHIRTTLAVAAHDAWEQIGNPFRADAAEDAALFTNDWVVDACLARYAEAMKAIQCVSDADCLHLISSRDTVWEGAQGVLLDEDYGFHPYTTWSHVTLANAAKTLAAAGVAAITNIGVMRAYGHRHGAGPFPTEDSDVGGFVKEPHNGTNAWQGGFRTGWFDLPLARYGLAVAGGTALSTHFGHEPRIHQLALTHLDQAEAIPGWQAVTGYGLNLSYIPSPDDWSKRERLTSALSGVTREDWTAQTVNHYHIPSWIAEQLNVPVTIQSWGPTARDKTFVASPVCA